MGQKRQILLFFLLGSLLQRRPFALQQYTPAMFAYSTHSRVKSPLIFTQYTPKIWIKYGETSFFGRRAIKTNRACPLQTVPLKTKSGRAFAQPQRFVSFMQQAGNRAPNSGLLLPAPQKIVLDTELI
ncbi:MAG: hypothetical protein IKV55_00875 [Oscillospiraceae bacterium]|nr:hypothetical protein [Oscillospiraceae bacterium]